MTLVGPCVLDVVQHFVERWNEIKKRKVCRTFIQAKPFSHSLHIVCKERVSPVYLLTWRMPIAYPQPL